MNISISPIKSNSINFRATQNGMNDNSAKEKKILTPQKAMEKRTKLAVGCCLATVLVIDVMYFVMKRKFKYHKIDVQKARELKDEALDAIKPETILEKIERTKNVVPNDELEKVYSFFKKILKKP